MGLKENRKGLLMTSQWLSIREWKALPPSHLLCRAQLSKYKPSSGVQIREWLEVRSRRPRGKSRGDEAI